MDSQKRPFFIFTGWIAIVVDIITLGQFIFSLNIASFWTSQWSLSLFFIIFLLGVGLGLLFMGGKDKQVRALVEIFGSAYLFASLLLYSYLSYAQIRGILSFGDFAGVMVLFVIALGVGTISYNLINKTLFKWPSYGYGTGGLLLIFALIYKYVFKGSTIEWSMAGEVVMLLIGSFLFLSFYFESEADTN